MVFLFKRNLTFNYHDIKIFECIREVFSTIFRCVISNNARAKFAIVMEYKYPFYVIKIDNP